MSAGHIGEITVKSAFNMRGHLNKPEATAEVIQDGWLKTDDLGTIYEDGLLTILGRKKNIIILGGENIAFFDFEGVLHRHPNVAESCTFPVTNVRLCEVVGAALQLRLGMSTPRSDIKAFLRDHIAHSKIHERIWTKNDPLPSSATDKLDRRGSSDICLSEMPQAT